MQHPPNRFITIEHEGVEYVGSLQSTFINDEYVQYDVFFDSVISPSVLNIGRWHYSENTEHIRDAVQASFSAAMDSKKEA